jgi:Lon protease-like protein
MEELNDQIWEQALPVFPLPNCVLLPGGLLPLHLFEPRYRRMMLDLLDRDPTDRHLAMALLRPGYEQLYHTNEAAIHPVVCVGTVLQHEPLEDGRFNLLLLGRTRARVRVEDATGPYRRAVLAAIEPGRLPEPDEADQARHELRQCLDDASELGIADPQAVDKVFAGRGSIEALVDTIAFYFIASEAYPVKQQILETPDVRERIRILRRWLEQLVHRTQASAGAGDRPWPPPVSDN